MRRAAALASLLLATPARPDPPPLAADAAVTAAGLALLAGSALAKPALAPAGCRLCAPGRLDAWARGQLVWRDRAAASRASDAGLWAIAGGSALHLGLSAGGARQAAEDLLLTVEAVTLAALVTQAAKYAVGRARPDAWYGRGAGPDANLSFWSGHTAMAFSTAAAAGTVARERGYPGWPWIYGLGFAAAGAVGFLRIAADRHWLTDVVAGAGCGLAAGLALPALRLRAWKDGPALAVTVWPLGLAGRF